jgi:hypothetical protein
MKARILGEYRSQDPLAQDRDLRVGSRQPETISL